MLWSLFLLAALLSLPSLLLLLLLTFTLLFA